MLGDPDVIRIGEVATSGYLAPLPSPLFPGEDEVTLQLSTYSACQDGNVTLLDKSANHKCHWSSIGVYKALQ